MPNRKISELKELIEVDNNDVLPIVDISEVNTSVKNKRVSVSNLLKLSGQPYVLINSSGDLPSTTPVNLNGVIAIGETARSEDTFNAYFNEHTVSIGTNSLVSNAYGGIAIGLNSSAGDGTTTLEGAIAIGHQAFVNRTDSLSIGQNAYNKGLKSIAIGKDSLIDANSRATDSTNASNGTDIINLGYNAKVLVSTTDVNTEYERDHDADYSVNIGNNSTIKGSNGSILIGSYGEIEGNTTLSGNTGIGTFVNITDSQAAISIGNGAYVNVADYAIQLTSGTNSSANTLQYGEVKLADRESGISVIKYEDILVDNPNAVDGNLGIDIASNTLAFRNNDRWNLIEGRESYVTIASSSDTPAIEIGLEECIAIGGNARVIGGGIGEFPPGNQQGNQQPPSNYAMAIGYNSLVSAPSSIQLGEGVNDVTKTVKYLGTTIANEFGIQTSLFTELPTTTVLNGNLAVDTTNNKFYFYSSSQWREVGVSSSTTSTTSTASTASTVQEFSSVKTSNFSLNDSYHNQFIPVNVASNNVIITLDSGVRPGFTATIFLITDGVANQVQINTNSLTYLGRGLTLQNDKSAATISYNAANNIYYAVGDLI